MNFTIDGKNYETVIANPAVIRCREILDKLEDGKFLTYRGLAEVSGHPRSTLSKYQEYLKEYWVMASYGGHNRKIFGSKRTIEVWKKQMQKS